MCYNYYWGRPVSTWITNPKAHVENVTLLVKTWLHTIDANKAQNGNVFAFGDALLAAA